VVVAGRNESVDAWEVDSGTLLWSLPANSTRTLAVSADADSVAVAGDEALVRLLDLDDGTEILAMAGSAGGVYHLAAHPDGDRLVSTGEERQTRIWDTTPGGSPELGAIEVGSGLPHMVEFSPDGAEVGAATWDGTFERLAATGERLGLLDGQRTDNLTYPVVSPDWRLLASVDDGGQAAVRDLATLEPNRRLPPCTNGRSLPTVRCSSSTPDRCVRRPMPRPARTCGTG
jgi:WD40 repeat protein